MSSKKHLTSSVPFFSQDGFVSNDVVLVVKSGRLQDLAPVQSVHVGLNSDLEIVSRTLIINDALIANDPPSQIASIILIL